MQYAVGIQSASGLLACDSPSTFKYPFRSPRGAGVASGPPATAAFTPAYGFLEGPRLDIVTATFNSAHPRCRRLSIGCSARCGPVGSLHIFGSPVTYCQTARLRIGGDSTFMPNRPRPHVVPTVEPSWRLP